MNASAPRIARTLLLAALATAVAVGCSKKVKEEPPTTDTGSTGTTTTTPYDDGASTRPGAYGPADLDTDLSLHPQPRETAVRSRLDHTDDAASSRREPGALAAPNDGDRVLGPSSISGASDVREHHRMEVSTIA